MTTQAALAAPASFAQRFVLGLGDLGRAELAILKRSTGSTIAQSMTAAKVFYRLYGSPPDDRDEEVYFLIATLYGLNTRTFAGDFGVTMRALRAKASPEAIDRRFSVLLDGSFDLIDGFRPGGGELAYRLRQCVRLAASKEVGVDWLQLLADLRYWRDPAKRVQKRWARSYFGQTRPNSITSSGQAQEQQPLTPNQEN